MTPHRRWIVPAAVLVLACAVLLSMPRPTGIDEFFRQPEPPPARTDSASAAPGIPGVPDAVISFRVDVETNAATIDVTPPPPPAPAREEPTPSAPEPQAESPAPDDLDVDDLLDRAGAPRSGGASTAVDAIPPRPVEITWPETRRLKQCIGRSVEVRILVGDDGKVLEVIASGDGAPDPACTDAALAAARRIRFEPGRVGGLPVTLWTQVRIDFEKKK